MRVWNCWPSRNILLWFRKVRLLWSRQNSFDQNPARKPILKIACDSWFGDLYQIVCVEISLLFNAAVHFSLVKMCVSLADILNQRTRTFTTRTSYSPTNIYPFRTNFNVAGRARRKCGCLSRQHSNQPMAQNYYSKLSSLPKKWGRTTYSSTFLCVE